MWYPPVADSWHYAGLMTEDEGVLERPYSASEWVLPPTITLEGEWLVWDYFEGPTMNTERVSHGDGMLEEFIHLADAPPERILNYAKRWGVLEICQHDLPAAHNWVPSNDRRSMCRPEGWPGPCREPLEAWKHFSRQAFAMLSITDCLRNLVPPNTKLWAMVYEWNADMTEAIQNGMMDRVAITTQWVPLKDTINEWLQIGNVRIHVELEHGNGPRLVVAGGGLFGSLAFQISQSISGLKTGWATCASCGQPFFRADRKPQSGRRSFCENCGTPASKAIAARDYRARIKRAKQLHADGVPIKEIARQLKVIPGRVNAWLSKT